MTLTFIDATINAPEWVAAWIKIDGEWVSVEIECDRVMTTGQAYHEMSLAFMRLDAPA